MGVVPTDRRELRAWYGYEIVLAAFQYVVVSAYLGPFLTDLAERDAGTHDRVSLLGLVHVRPGSVYPFSVTITVLLQVVFLLGLGSSADFGGRRRSLMRYFGLVGGVATVGLGAVVEPHQWPWGCLLFIVGNLCFAVSAAFYQAFLPLLSAAHADVLKTGGDVAAWRAMDQKISSRGIFVSYFSGFVCLLVSVGWFVGVTTEPLGHSVVFVTCGVVGLVGTMWSTVLLRPRPGPPKPADAPNMFRRVWATMRMLKQRLPQTGLFLLSYFVSTDGVSTIGFGVGVVGQELLGLSPAMLGIAILSALLAAAIGNVFYDALARWFPRTMTPKRIVCITLVILAVVPIYVWIALRTTPEFILMAIVYGWQLGAFQANSRTIFSTMLPAGREGEMFAMMMLSDRGTSWLGPLLMGVIHEWTGSLRAGVGVITLFYLVGLAIMAKIDVEAGVRQAQLVSAADGHARLPTASGSGGNGGLAGHDRLGDIEDDDDDDDGEGSERHRLSMVGEADGDDGLDDDEGGSDSEQPLTMGGMELAVLSGVT